MQLMGALKGTRVSQMDINAVIPNDTIQLTACKWKMDGGSWS